MNEIGSICFNLPSVEICEQFQDLYCDLYNEFRAMGAFEQIENHREWKRLERDLGVKFTMNDLGNYGYLYYK